MQLLAAARAVGAGEIAKRNADSNAIAAAIQKARIAAVEDQIKKLHS